MTDKAARVQPTRRRCGIAAAVATVTVTTAAVVVVGTYIITCMRIIGIYLISDGKSGY